MPGKKSRVETDRGDSSLVFVGCVVQTPSFGTLKIDPNATIVVSARTGIIEAYYPSPSHPSLEDNTPKGAGAAREITKPISGDATESSKLAADHDVTAAAAAAAAAAAIVQAREAGTLQVLPPGEFWMPGLVDCHIHAPQYRNTGTGLVSYRCSVLCMMCTCSCNSQILSFLVFRSSFVISAPHTGTFCCTLFTPHALLSTFPGPSVDGA